MNEFKNYQEPQTIFRFRPLKAAKVSEISEATAASSVKPEDRVNFHIGNPIQDTRLHALYLQLVMGCDISPDHINTDDVHKLQEDFGCEESQVEQIKLLCRSIKHSAPYMPRGGFNRNKPNQLVFLFKEWLTQQQYEPLDYDLGVQSGKREIILTSGSIWEDLRVLFHSLSDYVLNSPSHIFLMDLELPEHLLNFRSLIFHQLPHGEETAIQILETALKSNTSLPTFLLLGGIINERVRRELRRFSLQFPLFFLEVNNAPNHLSLAREAGLMNRVLRFITPAAIDPSFSRLSITFVAGNAEFIKIIETVHFELKGTPASAEVELLTFLLQNKFKSQEKNEGNSEFKVLNSEAIKSENQTNTNVPNFQPAIQIVNKIEKSILAKTSIVNKFIEPFLEHMDQINQKFQNLPCLRSKLSDPFTGLSNPEILTAFFEHIDDTSWQNQLIQGFLSVFLSNHSEYSLQDCFVISGSARTALSLLGFHCGIHEIITVDLSWTYEHCFPTVEIISLKDDLKLDVDTIIQAVNKKIEKNPNWRSRGAVLLNNPHNASGKVFDEADIVWLLRWLLEKNIFVIDDLSYQNLAPTNLPKDIKTVRQIVNEMVKAGHIRSSQAQYVITVHSLSKTDCFAGARLCVLEILHLQLRNKFEKLNSLIKPNIMAILLAYLFYRNNPEKIESFWIFRNRIFAQRMQVLEDACKNLPTERNPFEIEILRPEGSMYPHMVIHQLPAGISLDWLASGLASKGIGLIPLSTFARTAKGYDLARKTFRLTLGGTDEADILSRKTRRVLIDLNRLIAEESTKYTRKNLPVFNWKSHSIDCFADAKHQMKQIIDELISFARKEIDRKFKIFAPEIDEQATKEYFLEQYLGERLEILQQRLADRLELAERLIIEVNKDQKSRLIEILEQELSKEPLENRIANFRQRLFDRTVHPTQMYALKVDCIFEQIIDTIINKKPINSSKIKQLASELVNEYLGVNVPIQSIEEADELVLDLKLMIEAEEWARWNHHVNLPAFLSFWGDWDGSTRPSGQGHRLVAAVLLENVAQLANFLKILLKIDNSIAVDSALLNKIQKLDAGIFKFWKLLNEITSLTNQLEKRYLSVLPFDFRPGILRKVGMRLHLTPDPITSLWQHNDHLERKMLKLRIQRRKNLEYYFQLNMRLRETIYQLLPIIGKNLHHPELALCAGFYRNLLRRFVLTPRIHQKMILAQDQFAIDTTVHNIMEINEISAKYHNPGMVLALQVSLSTEPEAIITLDRKLQSRQKEILRNDSEAKLSPVFLVPLFEDTRTIRNLESYLNSLWEYAVQSKRLSQTPADRFTEMVCEFFFAGSDLSQQSSQPAGAALYREAKHRSIRWLAERGLVGKVRIKLGSGEPMQRQGGYYDSNSGKPLLVSSKTLQNRLIKNLKDSTRRSAEFARCPLRGVLAGGDFRTFQSNLAEHLRRLSAYERANLIYHVRESQKYYESELIRAAEPSQETRLSFQKRGLQELERLTLVRPDKIFDEFIDLVTRFYQQILYGQEEDVVGIHVISYFISRATPTFRDRPTVRPSRERVEKRDRQIVESLAQTLPLFKHGSLLRAIGHNRAQTMILGVNQLTTGLFRTLSEFASKQLGHNDRITLISDRILPILPVHDILHTLRIYHDPTLQYVKELESTFSAGNSALLTLQEDNDSIEPFIGVMQKELLRRQGLDVAEFFKGDKINVDLIPAFRPEIAILLQPDIFNTDINNLLSKISLDVDSKWLDEMHKLMEIPLQIKFWRERIWQLIKEPIGQQVESFIKLAIAIHTLSENKGVSELPFSIETAKVNRLGTQITNLLRGVVDDSMRHFLISAVQYLSQIPKKMSEVPIDVFRALRDVERILQIEDQVLGKKEQDLLRFYILKIARLCGENG